MSRRLTPIDIQHAEFSRSVGGFDRREVRAFLERLSVEVEGSLRENQGLRQQLEEAEARTAELKAAEAELQRAVMAAERIATDLKENARREAQLVLEEAERQRRERLQSVEAGMHHARADLSRLEHERTLFKEQFRGLLQAYLRGLDADDHTSAARPGSGNRATEGRHASAPDDVQATANQGPDDVLLDDSVQP